jgi:putative membrane protein
MNVGKSESRRARTARGVAIAGAAAFLVFGAASVSSFAQDDQRGSEQHREGGSSRDQQEGMPTSGHTERGGGMDRAGGIDTLTALNTSAIELARLAREHANSPRVRSYADDVIRDHTEAQSRVDELARSESITPSAQEASTRVRTEASSTRGRLESMSGEAFDRAYVDSEIQMHRRALDVIDDRLMATGGGEDSAYRELVRSFRTTITQELTRANALRGELSR